MVKATDGTVVQEMLHDEFGRVVKNTAPGFQPFGFAGGLFDHNTNLVQFGARWYDPQVGRWMSKDPILFAGGSGNLYGYVSNDPVNFIDPTGLTQADIDKALSIVSGVYPVIKQTPISYRKFMDDTSALAEINLFAKNRLIIDSDNLKELNEHQKTELLNTLFHEAKHLNDGYPGHMLDFWSPKDKDGLSSYHKSIYLKSSELTTKYNQCN